MIPEKSLNLDTHATKQQLLDEIESLQKNLVELEDKVDEKDERHRNLEQALRIGYWEWDEIEDRAIYYSDEVAAIFGVKSEVLENRDHRLEGFYPYIHPEDLEHYKKNSQSDSQSDSKYRYPPGEAHSFDYRLLKSDGEIRHIREINYRVANSEGVVTYAYGLVQDITEQQRSVASLLESEERFSSLFRELPIGVQEEDYSSIKRVVDKLVHEGVEDLKGYLESHPQILYDMVAGTSITNVNERLLKIHEASSPEEYLDIEADIDS